MRAHQDFVIIEHGGLVAATRVNNGDEAIVFALHFLVGEAELAQQFDAANLEPDEMIRVIDDAHLVSLGVADADAGFIDRVGRIGGRGRRLLAHRPVHFGLRFSRNDVTPSRKSAVARIAAFSRTAASICELISTRAWSLRRRLVYVSEAGLFSISCVASSRARSSSLSGGTISLIRPMRRPSCESKSLPVSSRSRAIFSPT